ncbi:MAG: VWA domain-containing protein [Natronomonas sp.]
MTRRGHDTAGENATTSADTPDFPAARQHVLGELLRFVSDLRGRGVAVPTTGSLDAARGLAVVGFEDRDVVAATLRSTLVTDETDLEAFEAAFPTFWQRLKGGLDRIATAEDGPTADQSADGGGSTDATDSDSDRLEADDPPELEADGDRSPEVRISTGKRHTTSQRAVDDGGEDARRYSPGGESTAVDVESAALSATETAAVDRFIDSLSGLPGRRRHPADTSEQIEVRRALRSSLETGGLVLERPTTGAKPSELRCCLLVDVSGSVLDTIERTTLLSVVGRLGAAARQARVFFFDTDLVDVSREFTEKRGDPAAALRRAEVTWGGGTQIGAAFEQIRDEHPHAVDRRTVVVIVSDGLDVGDAESMEAGITWLADSARSIVWLNPLAVSADYEPRSRGMATALPYVDGLFGFASPADLAEAARQIEHRGLGGSIGYEYDPRRTATDGRWWG